MDIDNKEMMMLRHRYSCSKVKDYLTFNQYVEAMNWKVIAQTRTEKDILSSNKKKYAKRKSNQLRNFSNLSL